MKLRPLTREHIPKNIPKFSKIHDYYTRRAHVPRDVSNAFRERTCKHESKRKSYESSERRFNHHSLQLKDLQDERAPEVIGRPGALRDFNHSFFRPSMEISTKTHLLKLSTTLLKSPKYVSHWISILNKSLAASIK